MSSAEPVPGPANAGQSRARTESELLAVNHRFYDALWRDARLIDPERFNTWPLVQTLLPAAPRRLEVAPGLRPRLPLAGTHFVDISPPALDKIRARGGNIALAPVTALPFDTAAFDLVCALDIVEHVDDDDRALAEIARVAAPGAALIVSVPLHPDWWTPFDDFVGHRRRYEPDAIVAKLARNGITVAKSALFGMKPKSSRLVDIGMWFLQHRRERAMWMYNRVFMPLGVRWQKPLALVDGLIDTAQAGEVLLLCQRDESPR